MRSFRIAHIIGGVLISGAGLCTSVWAGSTHSAESSKTSLPAGVSESWWSQAQREIQASEYHATFQSAGLQAPNRAHNLRTWFDEQGALSVCRADASRTPGEWQWGLALVRYGWKDGAMEPAAPAKPQPKENVVTYHRGSDMTEWYVNDAKGLKSWFKLASAPSGAVSGPLRLELELRGNTRASLDSGSQAIGFVSPAGAQVIRYGGLKAWDASGRELSCRLGLETAAAGQRVLLDIDASGAVFPVTIDPVAASPVWTVESDQANANFGYSVSTAGDVNGDGYSDVIAGAPYYDSGQNDEGRAFVYLGSASGLAGTPAWTAESDVASSLFGANVAAAGDVNGDGYSDVLVGAYGYTNTESYEGAAFVWYGSASGLGANGTPANADWTAEGNQVSAQMGYSVSTAGDVNGDGYSDIIVGTPYYDNDQTDEGRAFVYLGSSSGLAGTPAWTAESNQTDSQFASKVSTAGDVNGDGYSDIVIGAFFYSNGESQEGQVFVYLGSASGLGANGTPANADWTAESNQDSARFGSAVSTAGDVNGDGYGDMIAGASAYDNGESNEGAAFVWYGSASGLGANGTPANADWTVESNLAGGECGSSVATAGDINGDGYADVIVGVKGFTNDQNREGRAELYLGSASGLAASPVWTLEGNQAWAYFPDSASTAGDVNGDGYSDIILGAVSHGMGKAYVYYGSPAGPGTSPGWTGEGNQANSFYGWVMTTAGDVNGDGYSDVIVGARTYDNGETDEGRVYAYYGSASGLSTSPDWTIESNQAFANLGWSVASAGDVNGDGYGDVIVGAIYYDNPEPEEGQVSVYYGSATGLATSPAWTGEGNQSIALFGHEVSTAGDVNGDGYSDILVGADGYDNGNSNEGAVFLYYGSASGLGPNGTPANADWTAEGGQDNAFMATPVCAGDVNGDGYSDVLVGADSYDNDQIDEGRVWGYYGSPTGLGTVPNWSAEGGQDGVFFGYSASPAGDVNGDGYSDVIIGAPRHDNGNTDEGRAYVYYGSASGLQTTPAWTAEAEQNLAELGHMVCTAGDVNGDGYSDVLVGAHVYDNGESNEGAAFLWLGSASGLGPNGVPANADWSGEGNQIDAFFGTSVAPAGDVNGDGYADILVGADSYDSGEANEGKVYLYYGNCETTRGLSLRPKQFFDANGGSRSDIIELQPLGRVDREASVELGVLARTPFGRAKVKLQTEVKPLGTAFNGSGTTTSAAWTDIGTAGTSLVLDTPIPAPPAAAMQHWRARLLYHPATAQGQLASRWINMPLNGTQEADFRVPPPAAPGAPGATAIAPDSITWTWSDNSGAEAGYKVWDDPGAASPATLRTTTTVNVSQWKHDGLSTNTQHTFQTAATNVVGDSAKTTSYTTWTLAATPLAPTVAQNGDNAVNVAISAGDTNPAGTKYAIFCTTTSQWVQADGTRGASPVWQSAWGTVTVTGLTRLTSYSFTATARNEALVETAQGPAGSKTTLPVHTSSFILE